MEFFVPPADVAQWYDYWKAERFAWYQRLGVRPDKLRLREHDAGGAGPLLDRHRRRGVRVPVRLGRAGGHRRPRRLRPEAARRVLGREARLGRSRNRRPLRAARDRARRRRRPGHHHLHDRRLRRGGGRGPRARAAAPAPQARPRQGRRAAAAEQGGPAREGAGHLRGAARANVGRVRHRRVDRQALPAPGRDRHPVGHHRRPPDDGGRHRHAARPRLAGADPDRRRPGGRRADRRLAAEWVSPKLGLPPPVPAGPARRRLGRAALACHVRSAPVTRRD